MKKGLLLIAILLVIGCDSKQTKNIPADKDLISINAPIEGVTYSGGDGSTIEQAVIIKAPDKYTGIRGELYWLKKNRPGWYLERQSVLKSKTNNKVLDKMIFRIPQGDLQTVFFDVTDFSAKK